MNPNDKPPYRVPSMAEVAAVPWNGFAVASTFAGCGGSCLGYRMAGFRVVWANEFIPAAREAYRANHPETALDPRDIRQVKPENVKLGAARALLEQGPKLRESVELEERLRALEERAAADQETADGRRGRW